MKNATIGIVEDDPHIREIVEAYLHKEGYETSSVDTAEKAWDLWQDAPPDLWVLDIMLPGMNGYDFCSKIRQESDVPIIIISARDEEVDKVLGLELGSDDYLTKPFSPRELVARVNRMVKRWEKYQDKEAPAEGSGQTLKNGDLTLSVEERRVFWQGEEVEVTAKEFSLLQILVSQTNRAFSREELLHKVWGDDYFGSDRAVDDLVKRLRKKFDDVPIETVWGYGYRLREQGA
ncbi:MULTISPECIES: response regulator transcription factor [Pontibacillus]|uniref:Response regulator transcription factor n=1 Tax=Pontibacillus chungwhensis TaxID=265426 RepID=A0ABY8UZ18_9BACI|nr:MULTISPECIES: response regulator transcription factor [Pontibacillus]MCD5325752.1 response regulator transcription factor [Pontibacillus sp. HN14]WIF98011.1 response regulator transcription factor [Pontibacillus chungwhensis]